MEITARAVAARNRPACGPRWRPAWPGAAMRILARGERPGAGLPPQPGQQGGCRGRRHGLPRDCRGRGPGPRHSGASASRGQPPRRGRHRDRRGCPAGCCSCPCSAVAGSPAASAAWSIPAASMIPPSMTPRPPLPLTWRITREDEDLFSPRGPGNQPGETLRIQRAAPAVHARPRAQPGRCVYPSWWSTATGGRSWSTPGGRRAAVRGQRGLAVVPGWAGRDHG